MKWQAAEIYLMNPFFLIDNQTIMLSSAKADSDIVMESITTNDNPSQSLKDTDAASYMAMDDEGEEQARDAALGLKLAGEGQPGVVGAVG